jgi:hypothetical protein
MISGGVPPACNVLEVRVTMARREVANLSKCRKVSPRAETNQPRLLVTKMGPALVHIRAVARQVHGEHSRPDYWPPISI